MSEIRLSGVEVTVPVDHAGTTRTLLTEIDLHLVEQRIAIIGANGSGKSTLLRLLNGLVEPTRGEVLVNGLNTRTQGRQVRQQVGFIFPDPLAQLVMSTPAEDVELSLRRRIRRRSERVARARELLAARGLGELADQSVHDLSGGERQLVSLTSVLAVEPRVLVADEPTTLLDLRNREQLRRAFTELDQQLILATHDLEVARDATRVLVVQDARVVCDDIPEVAIDHYRRLMA